MKMLLSLLTSLLFATNALAATAEEDITSYVRIFSGDASLHSEASDTLVWKGLSDTRIFDIIEKRLLADATAARTDKQEKNRVARYLRDLGFSGQPKYIPTSQKCVADDAYERYAKTALLDLPDYQRWNPIISNRASFDPKLSDDTNRVMNMLRADDFMLKRIGAKRVYYKHQEPEVLDLLAKELKANYSKADQNNADAVAWMVKALGQPLLAKYKPVIEDVAANARDEKVTKHANKVLEIYQQKGAR